MAAILDAPLSAQSDPAWSAEAGAASFIDSVDLRSSLPQSGRAIVVSESPEQSAEGMQLFVQGEALEALSHASGDLGAEEWLGILVTSVGHVAGEAFGDDSSLAVPRVLTLEDSVWEGDSDPLGPGRICTAEIRLTPAGGDAVSLRFFAAEEALAGPLAALAQAEFKTQDSSTTPGSAGDENLLLLRADPALEERIHRALGDAGQCRRITELAELVAEFRDPEITGAVVEIREGRDYLLPLLRGLKDFPGCEAKPMVIVLDPAERMRVRECGRLGLWAVLGADFESDDLSRRLHEERHLNA